jgi:hypothetical protein
MVVDTCVGDYVIHELQFVMLEIVQSETFRLWRTTLKDRQAVARINARIRRLAQ